MQNIALIGVLAVIALGGVWYLSNTGTETSTPDILPISQTDEASDTNEMNEESMAMEDTMEDEAIEPDIVATAVATDELSTLVTAVTEAELVATLESEGPFTVFAPTNDAFAALPDGTLETLLEPANQADLQSILTYHVVPGDVMAADLSDGMEVETVNGETLTINMSDAGVTINGQAMVTTADVATSNGVVHIIDGVLLPESMQ